MLMVGLVVIRAVHVSGTWYWYSAPSGRVRFHLLGVF